MTTMRKIGEELAESLDRVDRTEGAESTTYEPVSWLKLNVKDCLR